MKLTALFRRKRRPGHQEFSTSDAAARHLVEEVAALLIRRAKSDGAEALTLVLEQGLRFTYLTKDGRRASGAVSPQVQKSLWSYLTKIALGGTLNLSAQEEVKVSRSGRNIEVFWGGLKVARPGHVSAEPQAEEKPLVMANAHVEAPAGVVSPEPESAACGELVLVVDDNQLFVKVLDKFLSREGFQVKSAFDGEQAWRLLSEGLRPALVVCDVHMPVLNGTGLLERVRAASDFDAMPFIFLTSDEEIGTEIILVGKGADGFVLKSEDPRLLCAYVKRFALKRNTREAA